MMSDGPIGVKPITDSAQQTRGYSCGVPGCRQVHRTAEEADAHLEDRSQLLVEG